MVDFDLRGLRPLGRKLTVLLGLVLSVVLVVFSYLVIHLWQRSYVDAAIADTERFSDTIKRSMEYSMLHARREEVHQIITAVGGQKGVEWVRLINPAGRIVDSNRFGEAGTVLDKGAEPCSSCHGASEPKARLSSADRSRIVEVNGHRVLAAIDPIDNRPACSTAACHAHPPGQKILGVLDVALSLEGTDSVVAAWTWDVGASGLATIVAVCLLVGLFLRRFVGRPVSRLVQATDRLARGDFQERIPVDGKDELALLGVHFNRMTDSLRRAHEELHNLNLTLERRVAERTEELRAAEAQVVRGERLASIGRMAAGVAHELNNPLTGVLTFAHLLARKAPEGSPDRQDLEVIIGETQRCAKIIRELLQFSRDAPIDKRPHSVNQLLRETLELLRHQAAFHNIETDWQLDEALEPHVLDAGQVKQVFMNILMNAAQAMPDGGVLTIRTTQRSLPGIPGTGELVEIADTGCGILPADLERIFDPFFTTKDPGKGTGLGLAVSLKIIENHGGTIRVESQVGRGSTFAIFLPYGAERAVRPPGPEAATPAVAGA